MKRTRLATALKMYLALHDISQKDLAKAWDCSESCVTRFLSGESTPEARTMMRIITWFLEIEA